MSGFFRRTALMVLACTVSLCPVLAVDIEGFPNDISDYLSVEVTPDGPGVESGPVEADASSDDRQIVVNVSLTPPAVEVTSEAPVVNVEAPVVNVDVPLPEISMESLASDSDGGSAESVEEFQAELPAYSTLTLDPYELSGDFPGDTVRTVLENLLGRYTPRTQTVTAYLDDGTEITYQEYVPGLAGMDWTWLASLQVFALILFCLFRLLGGVVSHV